jgi:hypothetical protein
MRPIVVFFFRCDKIIIFQIFLIHDMSVILSIRIKVMQLKIVINNPVFRIAKQTGH